ncbi:MAG: extracellular solute-binding protein, partial [Oscillospiraceae bacterium]|nr:extracellular solute-binding protein [Oscillospiraceae bacterium]
EYQAASQAKSNFTLAFSIDGKQPFNGLSVLLLTRQWRHEAGADSFIENGNDLRPTMIEDLSWQPYCVKDREGKYAEPYAFYLEAGEHTLSFRNNNEELYIRNIRLSGVSQQKTYEQYLKEHQDATKYDGEDIFIEAEKTDRVSSRTVIAINDMSSPFTTPYDPYYIKLNTLGGNNWKHVGERATWKINVPSDGLYRISMRFRQNYYNGIDTHRSLYINGEIPFEEAKNISFAYGIGWQVKNIGDYYLYLDEGENEIALEVVLGENGAILKDLEKVIYNLNRLYRLVIMVTGTTPDIYRDYNLDKEIPDLMEMLEQYKKEIWDLFDLIEQSYGEGGSELSTLTQIRHQLDDMYKNPSSITRGSRLNRFKTNISSLGAWANKIREQPVEIDSIYLFGEGAKPPQAETDLFHIIAHRAKRFLASFLIDYSVIGDGSAQSSIRVWVSTGRDQAQLLKNMIDDTFTPKFHVSAQVELVQGGFIEAVLAGQGPDIALDRPETDPVNYAMRNSLYDLSAFEDFDEVTSWFEKESIIPFRYEKGYYGLPVTQSFDMMFYRIDIFEELGMKVPKTWDELVLDLLPILQSNNMSVGIGILNECTAFKTLLYQNGGQIYSDDLKTAALDTQIAYQAFKDTVELYTDYGMPQTYDFMNRFRSGEMPIGLANYTMYNNLNIGAPELSGLWEMVEIPGILDKNSSINNKQIMANTAAIMNADSINPKAAWAFLKWWVSSETQSRYGNEIESILGVAGRYTPANVEAMRQLPWEVKQLQLLEKQRNKSISLPNLPGSYFTSRAIHNAFVSSVIDSRNPREELMYWNEEINMELERKRKEFAFKPELQS